MGRALAAAAIFLALSCLKYAWPGFSGEPSSVLKERMECETVVLYFPEDAVTWLGLD